MNEIGQCVKCGTWLTMVSGSLECRKCDRKDTPVEEALTWGVGVFWLIQRIIFVKTVVMRLLVTSSHTSVCQLFFVVHCVNPQTWRENLLSDNELYLLNELEVCHQALKEAEDSIREMRQYVAEIIRKQKNHARVNKEVG